jgi:hypothetical protein
MDLLHSSLFCFYIPVPSPIQFLAQRRGLINVM